MPIPQDKTNVTVTLPPAEKKRLEKLADDAGMSRNQYLRAIIAEWFKEGATFETGEPRKVTKKD